MTVEVEAAELVDVADAMPELGSVPLDRIWRRNKCRLIIPSAACISPPSVRDFMLQLLRRRRLRERSSAFAALTTRH